MATGASSLKDVKRAVSEIKKFNKKIVLMQCNTNYTADYKNHSYLNLNVLKEFKKIFKDTVLLGLSDHTEGHNSVLGAVALGARVIEKHFTDDNDRNGPDHKFSMNPFTWKKMVTETRILEKSLGDGNKKIEKNELESVIVQRRSIRAARNIFKNEKVSEKMLTYLRPAPKNSLEPFYYKNLLNKRFRISIKKGDIIKWSDLKS